MGIVVIGAGGHAKVVVALCKAAGVVVDRIVDDDLSRDGTTLLGVPVHAPCRAHVPKGAHAVVAIGNNRTRLRVVDEFSDVVERWATLVHPSAFVDPSVRLGEGTVVFAGAVVQVDSVIGAHCIINTRASVDHDATIDDGVHLAPGVHLAGNVTVGPASFVGIGAVVTPGKRIGKGVTIGAGAVVVRDVADDVIAVGVPARVTSSIK